VKKPPAKGAAISTKPSEPSVHPAIHEIRVGRGYGVTIVPVVNFCRFQGVDTLHVLGAHGALCGVSKTKDPAEVLVDCDPHALIVLRKPVCARCRGRLGQVPMPRLVIDQGDQ